MRALLSVRTGGPETLVIQELAEPTAGPGEVVVRIKACGVNFPDVLMIEDRYQSKPERPFAPGGEVSGIVSAVGAGVTDLAVGDRVLGNVGQGGMAEAVAVEAWRLMKIPPGMPFDEASAFITTFGTTYHALKDRSSVKPGQTLLVLGAAGGVGLTAVTLGKAMGARVVAAASTQEKVDVCLREGADVGVVYGRGPFDRDGQKKLAEQFKDACGPDGADVIYDAVGGDYAEPALRSIAWEGRYLVIGFAAGDIPKIPINLALLKGCEIVGVFFGAWVTRNPERHRQNLVELLTLYEAGKIRPLVSESFPLERGGEAIERLRSRQAVGKVVVTMD
jgi:NADPH2:quinone reductase